jgi:hypothetical protein
MEAETRWTLRAAGGFAAAAAIAWLGIAAVGVIEDGLRELPASRLILYALIAMAIASTVGGLLWVAIVERSDRWSTVRRGATVGGLTGWLSLPLTLFCYLVFDPIGQRSVLETFLFSLVAGGVIGAILIGWATVPVGVATGYWLARRRE